MAETIATPLTSMLGIKYPILLAGMNGVAGPELAAAVTNAGGLGVIGGVTYTPKVLTAKIKELKDLMHDKNGPFGIDLLLPQVGGNARATNTDYTKGKLPELIDIVCNSGCTLFISAVGVPPKWAVDKLHAAGIPVMNMIGSTRHVAKAVAQGVDLICAQGTEGGGHTGETATTVLLPQVVDMCKKYTSPFTGKPIMVVGAGGIFDGRGLATCLSLGAQGAWVGTRFICSTEAGCPPRHQTAVQGSTSESTIRTIIYTGRPMRVIKNDYILDWENNRQDEIVSLTSKGTIPVYHDAETKTDSDLTMEDVAPLLMGQACGATYDILPAKDIVEDMVTTCIATLREKTQLIQPTPAKVNRMMAAKL